MSAKKPIPHSSAEDEDDIQEGYDDEDDDDSEFDENAAASSSDEGDDDGDHGAVLDGTLALDENSHLHFQGDAFHLVSTEPVRWGVLNFAQWKATSGGVAQFAISMSGACRVDVPSRQPPEKPHVALKSPPPPSSSLKAPPPSQGNLKSPPNSAADASSSHPTNEDSGRSQRTFVFNVAVTDYTGTKSDPSIRRIDHEHTHVPTNPDCRYHIEAMATGTRVTDTEDAPARFRGDYFPKDSDEPCRTVCKLVRPRRTDGPTAAAPPDDAKLPPAASVGKTLSENGGHYRSDGTNDVARSSSAASSSPYAAAAAAAAARASTGDDSDDDDVDGDYDEDVDGDELLALQQEAAMPTDEVLRKRYRGNTTGGETDEPYQDGKLSAAKKGRKRDDDDDDDSDYGF
jgi:hypothetical protein